MSSDGIEEEASDVLRSELVARDADRATHLAEYHSLRKQPRNFQSCLRVEYRCTKRITC